MPLLHSATLLGYPPPLGRLGGAQGSSGERGKAWHSLGELGEAQGSLAKLAGAWGNGNLEDLGGAPPLGEPLF